MSAEIKITFGHTGGSHTDDFTVDIEAAPPPPPVGVSVELYLIDEAGDPAWIDITGPFTRTDFLGTEGQHLLIEGILDSAVVTIERECAVQEQYPSYGGGRLTFTLRNLYGEWDPLNELSPWFVDGATLLKQGAKGTPVRVNVTPPGEDAVPQPMFTGRVSSWPPSYIGDLYSSVTVVATDGVEQLKKTNLAELNVSVDGGSSAGFRINRILNNASWDTANDDVDETLVNSMQPTTFKSDAWSEIQLTADSDVGFVWMNKLGGTNYRTRYHTIKATPTLVFSMNAETGTYQYQLGLENSFDTSQTGNVVKQQREGGRQQAAIADDAAANGYSSFDRQGLLMETDRQAMNTAHHSAGAFRRVVFRPTLIPVALTATDPAWLAMLAAELFDTTEVTQVTPSPPGVDGRDLTSRVINTGFTWRLQPASGKYNLDISAMVAPPVLPPAKVGTAKVGASVVQFAGAA